MKQKFSAKQINKQNKIQNTKTTYIADFKNISSFSSTESHQDILPDYDDLVTSLQITSSISPIFFQVIKFIKSFSQTTMAYKRFECCCFSWQFSRLFDRLSQANIFLTFLSFFGTSGLFFITFTESVLKRSCTIL